LYYNPDTSEWKVIVNDQEGVGLHTEEIETQVVEEPWCHFGSIHHHCNATAFQSGTDLADEYDSPGFHVTVGNLDEKLVSIHARFVYNDLSCEVENLSEFFDVNEEYALGILSVNTVEEKYDKSWDEAVYKEPVQSKNHTYPCSLRWDAESHYPRVQPFRTEVCDLPDGEGWDEFGFGFDELT
jgi:hypothetical protein